MASWGDWFKAAHQRNIRLEDSLVIDLDKDIERLYSSGLPVYARLIIGGKDYPSKREEIKDFCKKYERTWIKVYNAKEKRRYSAMDLRGYEKLIEFIDGLKINLDSFDIHLSEFQPNKFGGNVLTDERGTVIEMIDGHQDIISKSTRPFFHGYISESGTLKFHETNIPEEMRIAAWRTLQYLKISGREFLPGYFEFMVSDKDKIYFFDYKTGFK